MWKLESDEGYFRIYDSKKMIAGYFDPDYGDVPDGDEAGEVIDSMIRNHDEVPGGAVMVPLVKFRLFDTDLDTSIYTVQENTAEAVDRLQKWADFLARAGLQEAHSVRISHTDQDMLTITFPVRFTRPTPLERKRLLAEIGPTLDSLQGSGLL